MNQILDPVKVGIQYSYIGICSAVWSIDISYLHCNATWLAKKAVSSYSFLLNIKTLVDCKLIKI